MYDVAQTILRQNPRYEPITGLQTGMRSGKVDDDGDNSW